MTANPPAAEVVRLVPRGAGTVLLVEKEDEMRKLAVLALRAQGYEVLEARGGAEALQFPWGRNRTDRTPDRGCGRSRTRRCAEGPTPEYQGSVPPRGHG